MLQENGRKILQINFSVVYKLPSFKCMLCSTSKVQSEDTDNIQDRNNVL